MDEIIEKYRIGLTDFDKQYEESKHLMGEDAKELLNNLRIILVMIITDLEAIKALNK